MEPSYDTVLQELSSTPGARYSCIADAATRSILAERGAGDVDPITVLGWGGSVAAGLADGDEPDGLDDLIVTGARSYHLLRRARASAVRPLLVYVCLDRTRSNLALARRALSAVVGDQLDTVPTSPDTPVPPSVRAAPAAAPGPPDPDPRPSPAPVLVPLPRRSPAPVQAAAPAPRHRAAGPRWADDVSTMRRLLAGLRALGNSP